jgi:hypothetical protein
MGPLSGNRLGEDIVLSNVLAFDVRVFDPAAEVRNNATAGVAVVPGDSGYSAVRRSLRLLRERTLIWGMVRRQVFLRPFHLKLVTNRTTPRDSFERTTHGAIIMSSMESMKIISMVSTRKII